MWVKDIILNFLIIFKRSKNRGYFFSKQLIKYLFKTIVLGIKFSNIKSRIRNLFIFSFFNLWILTKEKGLERIHHILCQISSFMLLNMTGP